MNPPVDRPLAPAEIRDFISKTIPALHKDEEPINPREMVNAEACWVRQGLPSNQGRQTFRRLNKESFTNQAPQFVNRLITAGIL